MVSVHADQNILFHSLATRSLTRQLVGYNDEVVDATFLSPYSSSGSDSSTSKLKDTHVALATNSSLIRVYSASQLDARLLPGHSEIVLCLDRDPSGRILVSGSKDRSARIWVPVIPSSSEGDPIVPSIEWRCSAICEGHAESVGAIAISRKSPEENDGLRFMFTGSQDKTIKMWDLSSVSVSLPSYSAEHAITKCKSLTTHKAHEKDINSIDIAPNDRCAILNWKSTRKLEAKTMATYPSKTADFSSFLYVCEDSFLSYASNKPTSILCDCDRAARIQRCDNTRVFEPRPS